MKWQYETIVVGAGASGAVIASRITENAHRSVLLLEAGPDYVACELPADLTDGTRNSLSRHDWGFIHRQTRKGRFRFPFPRGKVVGGSSAVNTCIALRGMPYDYDEWGLDDWTWEKVLPYFLRLETDLDFPDREHHGSDGPLPLRRHPREELCEWTAAFIDAATSMGFPYVEDHNAVGAHGVGPHAMNKLSGRRISAAEAWLTPTVRARENLTIRPNSLVERVVIEQGRAVGVIVDGAELRSERVVLCAGAICTPGMLLRSGIGPREELRRLGVPLVSDNPWVGARLLDHPGSAFFLRPHRPLAANRKDPVIQAALRTTVAGDERAATLQCQPGNCVPTKWVDLPLVSLMASPGKPRGSGKIRWSRDPLRAPVIENDFYEDPQDMETIAFALELLFAMSQTPVLRRLATPFWPPRSVLQSRGKLTDWIPHITDSGYHPCGTAPMGNDPATSAVDVRGGVWHVPGLFIGDASVFPTVPSCNIHVPTLMLGERFGEWLRGV